MWWIVGGISGLIALAAVFSVGGKTPKKDKKPAAKPGSSSGMSFVHGSSSCNQGSSDDGILNPLNPMSPMHGAIFGSPSHDYSSPSPSHDSGSSDCGSSSAASSDSGGGSSDCGGGGSDSSFSGTGADF